MTSVPVWILYSSSLTRALGLIEQHLDILKGSLSPPLLLPSNANGRQTSFLFRLGVQEVDFMGPQSLLSRRCSYEAPSCLLHTSLPFRAQHTEAGREMGVRAKEH